LTHGTPSWKHIRDVITAAHDRLSEADGHPTDDQIKGEVEALLHTQGYSIPLAVDKEVDL
jgi:hypothetical protein